MTTQKLYDKFHDFTIPPKSNPIKALHALEDTNNQITEKGVEIPDTSLHAPFVRALPDEYGQVKATLQAMKNRDRAEIICMVVTRYSTLPQKRGRRGRPGRPSKHSSRAKAGAGVVRDGVVTAVAGTPRAVALVGAAARVELAATEEAAAAAVVPVVVATAAVADLLVAVGDATKGATSGRSAPRRRANPSPSVLGTRVLATRRAHAHWTWPFWWWSYRCQKRILPWKLRRLWRRKQVSAV